MSAQEVTIGNQLLDNLIGKSCEYINDGKLDSYMVELYVADLHPFPISDTINYHLDKILSLSQFEDYLSTQSIGLNKAKKRSIYKRPITYLKYRIREVNIYADSIKITVIGSIFNSTYGKAYCDQVGLVFSNIVFTFYIKEGEWKLVSVSR